jgi:hypothetical protein
VRINRIVNKAVTNGTGKKNQNGKAYLAAAY